MAERKCYRKGGRRTAMENPCDSLGNGEKFNKNYTERAKQFAAFAPLRGFDELLEDAQREAAMEDDK